LPGTYEVFLLPTNLVPLTGFSAQVPAGGRAEVTIDLGHRTGREALLAQAQRKLAELR
jgi:hypothetical protein